MICKTPEIHRCSSDFFSSWTEQHYCIIRLSNRLKIRLCGSRKGKSGLNKGLAKSFLSFNDSLDEAPDDLVTGSIEITNHLFFSDISHFSSELAQFFSELEKPALFFRSPATIFRSIHSILAYSTGNTPPPTGRSRSDPPPNPQPHPKMGFFYARRPGRGLRMGLPNQQQISEPQQQFSELLTTNFRSLNNNFQKS